MLKPRPRSSWSNTLSDSGIPGVGIGSPFTIASYALLRPTTSSADGTTLAIDCIAIEDEYGNTPAQRAELDWLLYNKPLEYVQLVLSGEIEHYLSLGCDHGRLEG